MSENLKLKSIYELLCNEENQPESFFIPSYQRGYRWTRQQVEELLEDIWEFIQKEKTKAEFYCLQPIVVKQNKRTGDSWDIIDGQQRLTTIFIILKILANKIDSDNKTFDIRYETREKSAESLENLSKSNTENIDSFHISKAYEAVSKWFKNMANSGFPTIQSKFISPFLEDIKVIWYEIDRKKADVSDEENKYKRDIEIFTRINMEKIPLTNAELIKALLIQGYGNQKNGEVKQNKQFELASEWDHIEYSLQNDDFWYFINKGINEKATRIEFIFELIAEKYFDENKQKLEELKNSKSIDKYYEFHMINHYLQNDKRCDKEKNEKTIYEELWSEVKKYFRILTEWYEDREFFHKIGFLVIYGKLEKKALSMLDLTRRYVEEETKTSFVKFLDQQIKKVFKDIDIESLKYDESKDDLRKVFLWFNISTIVKNDKSNLRFQFDRYKKQNWDIEHIRSQTDKYPTKKEDKESWIEDISKIHEAQKTKNEILVMEEKVFNQFFDKMQKKIEGDNNEFDKDSIGNLTLLDSKTNRSYGNAFFPIKRKIIIENDMKGTFIPICTKNLFLKYYSKKATDLQKWTKEDAKDYTKKIIETFREFTKGDENEHQQ